MTFNKDRVFKENLFLESEEEFKVDYKREIAREKLILEKIDQVPLIQDERPLTLFKAVSRAFHDAKWVGRSISIDSVGVFIKPPYRFEDCKSRDEKSLKMIKNIIDNAFERLP